MAGVNGAGKTTTIAHPAVRAVLGEDLVIINPDRLVPAILQSNPALSGWDANIQAAVASEAEVWRLLTHGTSLVVETVLSTRKYEGAIKAARALGYMTGLIYLGLPDVRYSIERVAKRVAAGGHDVPREKLLSRWERSHDNFVRFLSLVDRAVVFSNTGPEPRLVAEKAVDGRVRLFDPDELPEITSRLQ